MNTAEVVNTGVQLVGPDDFNSVLDILKYAWVVLLYWGKELIGRVKKLEECAVLSVTAAEVEARVDREVGHVDKEMQRVNSKLDRVENMLLTLIQHKIPKSPHIDLGSL